MATGTKLADDLIAFTLALSLIAIALSAVAIVSVRGAPNIPGALKDAGLQTSHSVSGSAVVQLILTLPYGRAINAQASIFGHGVNTSVPIMTYYPKAGSSGTAAINNSQTGATPAVYPYANVYSQYSVVFPNLAPNTYYNVTLYGVTSPYCPPGSVCALGLALISQQTVIRTGANGTIANVTFMLG